MGLLDKLWDDVVAGPMPDRGLGRLRRPGGRHHHHEDDHGGDNDMGRMLERRRSNDFRAEEEEARRMAEQIMNPTTGIKKPPNLKLLRTESFPSDQQVTSDSASSTPRSPGSSSTGSTPHSAERLNVWRSVFNPGSNKAMDKVGSDKFDKAQPNSPTVYDWLYSGETKSSWR